MLLWIIIGLIALVVLVILGRAALFRPERPKTGPFKINSDLSEKDSAETAGRFAELLRCRTIHPARAGEEWQADGYREFERFRDLLKQYYPLIHNTLEYELVNQHSLLYRWPGLKSDRPLVLLAHYDVVPADESQWSRAPFAGEIDNRVIWGRGALDTKCTLFGIMEAVENLLAAGHTPAQDIYLAFGHDEETMGQGAPAIVELLKSKKVKPDLVLDEGGAIVEGVFPGVKQPIAVVGLSEKGLTDIEVILEGSGGHSSAPGRVTPLAVLSRIILQVEKNPFPAYLPTEVRAMFDTLGRHMPFALKIVFANLWLFKPLLLAGLPLLGRELNALCRTTSVFTMAEASKASNVIPERVRAVVNVRLAATDPLEKALRHLTDQALKASAKARRSKEPLKLTVNKVYGHNASPSTSPDAEAYKKIEAVIGNVFENTLVTPYIMLGASDARHFCAICDNVLRFSPLKMSRDELRSIHGIDEYISVDQLEGVIAFYYSLISKS